MGGCFLAALVSLWEAIFSLWGAVFSAWEADFCFVGGFFSLWEAVFQHERLSFFFVSLCVCKSCFCGRSHFKLVFFTRC